MTTRLALRRSARWAALAAGLVSLSVHAQPEAEPDPGTPAERTARAAEEAAAAAKLSAEAAARAAALAERLAATLPPEAEGAATAAGEVPVAEARLWSGSVGLGLIALTGNSQSVTISSNATSQYKTPNWIFSGRSSFVYGQSRPADRTIDPEILALAGTLQVQGDRRFTSRLSGFLGAGAETDHVKSVELRGFGEGGIGVLWLDDTEGDFQKRLLRSDLGLRYARELRFQYFPTRANVPDVTFVAPRVALTFLYALSKDVTFQQDAEILTNVLEQSRTVVNTLSKISARLVRGFSLGVGFSVKHDSSPAPGRVETDTALTVGLEAAF